MSWNVSSQFTHMQGPPIPRPSRQIRASVIFEVEVRGAWFSAISYALIAGGFNYTLPTTKPVTSVYVMEEEITNAAFAPVDSRQKES
ncbi:hypothetical protein M408DRAFT_19836 [Serendipita vermifera MAFF 305830]|uniref:Uncharacterized protein n=1 Tax=Serendipita vermifera MAFF 305830 TaxID=933852 RepID=A0A0C3BQ25_SERVB|nr:hypothetical protein M408DRAFT_19836 [Serendipita vermifera MAFF 305830]